MSKHSPNWFAHCAPTVCPLLLAARRVLLGLLLLTLCFSAVGASLAFAQTDRDSYLAGQPVAEVDVQPLTTRSAANYMDPNQQMLYQAEDEDPLSFYARTQDGEWQIPTEVNSSDPWVRLLILGPAQPTLVDVAIEINQQPFRAAREQWIDKLLEEAKAAFLVRAGEAAADAAGIAIDALKSKVVESNIPTELVADSDGTSDASDTSEQVAETEKSADEQDEEDIPMVSIQRRKASTLFRRLINYLAADQNTAEREEVRWLLAEWTGGPALLTLGPAFSWRRANTAPLWQSLDQDGNQTLTLEEIKQQATIFKKADLDRNETIDLSELVQFARQKSSSRPTHSHPLIVVLDENTDWKALRKHLRSAYGETASGENELPLRDRVARGDRSVSIAELMELISLPADFVYRVSFAEEDAKLSLLAVVGDADPASWRLHSSTDQAITVERTDTYMELTAAQGEIDKENASGDMQQTQIAIGAVVDGYPLFRLLDQDNNQKLTQRECGNVEDFVLALDRNQDGQIDATELPSAIRLAVTHGPQVHQELARPTAAQRNHGESTTAEAPPWFVGMDRNRDGDLSKREFQGSPSQFAKFDRDGDNLISRAEVQEVEGKN